MPGDPTFAGQGPTAGLEQAEAELLQELAAADNGDGGGAARPVVSFPDKETRTDDIRREIDTAINELNTGENWRQWLEFSGKFHRYSLNNQLLIYMQTPECRFSPRTASCQGCDQRFANLSHDDCPPVCLTSRCIS